MAAMQKARLLGRALLLYLLYLALLYRFQGRAEQQKCAEKPIGKVRRTLPIDIHDTSITPIDENDRKQSYNKGAGTDRSGLVRKARSID